MMWQNTHSTKLSERLGAMLLRAGRTHSLLIAVRLCLDCLKQTLSPSFLARAEVRNFEDALAYFEARFSRITLEDRNLAAIAQHRILRPKSDTARLQIKQAFEKVKREPESVRDVLLTNESTTE